ncbi:hypothetical protein D3C81_1699470 [compost metagenome]
MVDFALVVMCIGVPVAIIANSVWRGRKSDFSIDVPHILIGIGTWLIGMGVSMAIAAIFP